MIIRTLGNRLIFDYEHIISFILIMRNKIPAIFLIIRTFCQKDISESDIPFLTDAEKYLSRRENMDYNHDKNIYYCKNDKELIAIHTKTEKTASGYKRTVTTYECESCKDCPYKKDCIKGNNCKTPLEDRNNRLYVSRNLEQKRSECLERI